MKNRTWTYYTDSQKALMWECLKNGEFLQQIAQLVDRHLGSVRGILLQNGGLLPTKRCRSAIDLSLVERE